MLVPKPRDSPAMDTSIPFDADARRLLWRCRRGMKELDVLLERFARGMLPSASSGERRALDRFLELPDPVLVDYLLGQAIPEDAELALLVQRIAASVPRATSSPPLQSTSGAPHPVTPGP